jgi:hypothetical protein
LPIAALTSRMAMPQRTSAAAGEGSVLPSASEVEPALEALVGPGTGELV